MFESIQKGLADALRKLRGETKFTEANMRDGLREVRRALIEADVHIEAANAFIERVEKSALGRDVMRSLSPSQQIIEVVYQELIALMGPVDATIRMVPNRPTILMMCGLQGSGKTTTCAKLANWSKQQGNTPLLVAADLQRPAAVEQLKVLGEQLGVPVYAEEKSDPIRVCQNAITYARQNGRNLVILDTAGRLHIDDQLMRELNDIDKKVGPDQCFLVVDAMTGQDAVRSAKAFNDSLNLDGVVLTKTDGDARGGAALSIKHVTGVPIKFMGEGEKIENLAPFQPEGMASRILGMGDMLALVNKARQGYDEEKAKIQQQKIEAGKIDLNDFREHLGMLKNVGVKDMMGMLPTGLAKTLPDDEDPEESLKQVGAILDSMTPKERANPEIIDHSRRRRIAMGAGVEPHEINKLIKMFEQMKPMMQQMAKGSMADRVRNLMRMGQSGAFTGAAPLRQKQRSERARLTGKDLAKARKKERQAKKKNRKK